MKSKGVVTLAIKKEWEQILNTIAAPERYYRMLEQYSEEQQQEILSTFGEVMLDELTFVCALYEKKQGIQTVENEKVRQFPLRGE